MDAFTKGLLYLRQAHKALARDFKVAFEDEDWNIAVRRAQECVEFAVKGLLLILGENPPREHIPPRLAEDLLRKVPTVAYRIEDDPRLGRPIILVWEEEDSSTLGLWRFDDGVFTMMGASRRSEAGDPIRLEIEGPTIRVLRGDQLITTNTHLGLPLQGRWVQAPITDSAKKLIDSYVRKLGQQRDYAFYFDTICSRTDAESARKQAGDVLRVVLGNIGLSG